MEKLNNFWETLPVWDKVEALESLGINLKLSDSEIVSIAGEKARAEKEEELRSKKDIKARTKEFVDNMVKGMDFKESWENLFKIRK